MVFDHFYGVLNLGFWGYVAVAIATLHITLIAITLFYHREQAHRSVDLHPALRHFFRFWLWLNTGAITKQWVAVHRKHHATCETRRRSPQPADLRARDGAPAGCPAVSQGGPEPRDAREIRSRDARRLARTQCLHPLAECGHRLAVPRGCAALRRARRAPVRDPDDHHAPACRRRHQRPVACEGLPQLRNPRRLDQPVALRRVRGRRRAAQQSPCLSELCQVFPTPLGDRHGLAAPEAVRHAGAGEDSSRRPATAAGRDAHDPGSRCPGGPS